MLEHARHIWPEVLDLKNNSRKEKNCRERMCCRSTYSWLWWQVFVRWSTFPFDLIQWNQIHVLQRWDYLTLKQKIMKTITFSYGLPARTNSRLAYVLIAFYILE